MSEKMEITKEALLKAYDEAQPKQRTLLENLFGKKILLKKVTDRIKTLQDVFDDLNEDMAAFFEKCKSNGDEQDEIYYKVCKRICKVLNEGWVPNFNDHSPKYQIWWNISRGGFSYNDSSNAISGSIVGVRLCLKSEELAKYVATQFQADFEKFIK